MTERFDIEKGDTRISEIKYGVPILIIQHGRVVPRKFKERYCQNKDCLKFIKAKWIKCNKNVYRMVGQVQHNNSVYCCQSHINHKALKKPKIKKVTRYRQSSEGFKGVPATQRQADAMARLMIGFI